MKKFICTTVVVMSLLLSSCEKNTDDQSTSQRERDVIAEKALRFSKQHDQLVYQMLSLDNALMLQRAPSDETLNADQMRTHIVEVIKKVTGVVPVIADPKLSKTAAAAAGDNAEYYWVSLDTDEITLAQYALTEESTRYLAVVDDIVQNEMLSLDDKLLQLQSVLNEVKADTELSLVEMERVFTAIEVLKGSLNLWSEFQRTAPMLMKGAGVMKVSVRDWSFWKKLGFVSAADAVGGVLGLFMGGYIVVNGVPIYLPAGTIGMVGGAAALSYIAAKMVGW